MSDKFTILVRDIINPLIEKYQTGSYIFRGTTKKHKKVSSSLYRKYESKNIWTEHFNPSMAEKEIVAKARHLFAPQTTNIEILTNLRHYGGEVNLIDFSRDLHVALFFACNGDFGKDGEDGELIIINDDTIKTEIKDIDYDHPQYRIIEPGHTADSQRRILAQKSIFIYEPKGDLDKNKYETYSIEKKHKQNILEYLKQFHHITANTIYDDTIGFIANEENYISATIAFYQGLAKQKEGKHKEAIKDYDQAIKLNPDLTEAYNNRGNAKSRLKQYPEAIKDYDQAIKLNPDLAEAYNNRGIAKSDLKQYQEAIKDHDQAIKLNPEYAEAYNNRGNAKSGLEQYQEAIMDYDQAIKLNPDLAEAYYNRGIAKSGLEQYQEAIMDHDQAIKLNPKYAKAYNNRGVAKSGLEQYQEAIMDHDQAIKLNPKYAKAYNNRGVAKSGLKQYQEAIMDYDQAIKLNPEYAKAYNNRGDAKAKMGKPEAAIADYKQAKALFEQQGKIDEANGCQQAIDAIKE